MIAANVAAIILIAMTLTRFRKIILGKNQGMTVEGVIGAKPTPDGALSRGRFPRACFQSQRLMHDRSKRSFVLPTAPNQTAAPPAPPSSAAATPPATTAHSNADTAATTAAAMAALLFCSPIFALWHTNELA